VMFGGKYNYALNYLFFTSFPLCLYEGAPPPTHPLPPHHSSIPPTLGHQASTGPRNSSPIDDIYGYPLLHMYLEPWIPPCIYSLVGGLVSGSSEWSINWYCSSYGVAVPFSSFSPSSSFSLGVPGFSPMVVCEYLHLYWSGADRTSQGTAVTDPCQQVLGISNSVRVWCLQMRWISRWGHLWAAFSLRSIFKGLWLEFIGRALTQHVQSSTFNPQQKHNKWVLLINLIINQSFIDWFLEKIFLAVYKILSHPCNIGGGGAGSHCASLTGLELTESCLPTPHLPVLKGAVTLASLVAGLASLAPTQLSTLIIIF